MNPVIRPETAADHSAIHAVNRLAFGGDDEAQLVDALRNQGYVRRSLVAEQDGRIVGHILFSDLPIHTAHETIPALVLAPMSVLPTHQRRGIGSRLVREGLRACREAGSTIVVVLGHPAFYTRFSFSARLAEPLRSPYSGPSFLAVALEPDALDGVEGEVQYPPPFDGL